MNIYLKSSLTLLMGAFIIAPPLSAQSAFWAHSQGTPQSCQKICARNNANAVQSGHYTNGQPFYVCSGNVAGDGERPGFNLEPNWSNSCAVAWGNKSIMVKDFSCLCN